MKNSTQLFNCILIIALSCFYQLAKAQIVYTDIPDTILSNETFSLDLNNDGISDYEIMSDNGTTFKVVDLSILNDNEALTNSANAPRALLTNDIIDDNSRFWKDTSLQPMASSKVEYYCRPCYPLPCQCGQGWSINEKGPWAGKLDSYLGLRLHLGTNIYYGWIRLDIGSYESSFTVKDYAYNSIPDSAIFAGDTGGIATGIISAKNQNHFSVYPNPASDKITLSSYSNEKKEIQIANMLGQIVFAEEINSPREEIDVSEFPAGLYVVSTQTATQTIQNKFLKQ